MAKTSYVCSSCGYESGKWYGKCPECSNWNTFTEVQVLEKVKKSASVIDLTSSKTPQLLSKVKSIRSQRISTRFSEFDRVLGGGIVPGSAILLSGDPGVGKSTLLLELAKNLALKDRVLYISGEESESQIKIRAERLGVKSDENLFVFSNGDIDQVIEAAESQKPGLLIVDSIQTMSSANFPGYAGALPQIRHAISRLVSFAKKNSVPVFIVGHVTKEGEVAGPMLLSHMVDCVLYLEGQIGVNTRVLRSFKNRFGDTSEVGIFSMEETGMKQVDESLFFTQKKDNQVPGSCLTVVMEGTRPILVEIQALVVPSNLSFSRRVANGISDKRLELLLAVIQKHAKLPVDRFDVYVNVVGGLKITETASDLAVCLSIASSFKNRPVKQGVAIGEIGLLGEIKNVSNQVSRTKEAQKLGFKNVLSPSRFSFLHDIIKTI